MNEAKDHLADFSNEIPSGTNQQDIKELVDKKRQFILKTGHLPGVNVPNVNNNI
jgi:hypothetical protein